MAISACQAGDFEAGAQHFDKIINNDRFIDIDPYTDRARDEKIDCLTNSAAASKETSNYGKLLLSNLLLIETGETEPDGVGISQLFEQNAVVDLVSVGTCDRVDLLLDNKLIPDEEVNLPTMYLACAQIYQEDGVPYEKIIDSYDSIIRDFPQTNAAETAFAELEALYYMLSKDTSSIGQSIIEETWADTCAGKSSPSISRWSSRFRVQTLVQGL